MHPILDLTIDSSCRFQGVLYKMVTATESNSWHERLVTITNDAIVFRKVGDSCDQQNYVMDAIPLLEITECSRVVVGEDTQNLSNLEALSGAPVDEGKAKRRGYRKGGFRASSVRRDSISGSMQTQKTKTHHRGAFLSSRSSSAGGGHGASAPIHDKIASARASMTGNSQGASLPAIDSPLSPLKMHRPPSLDNLAMLPYLKPNKTKPRPLQLSTNPSDDPSSFDGGGRELPGVGSAADAPPEERGREGGKNSDASNHGQPVNVATITDDLSAPTEFVMEILTNPMGYNSGRIYRLAAPDPEQFHEWMHQITSAMQDAQACLQRPRHAAAPYTPQPSTPDLPQRPRPSTLDP